MTDLEREELLSAYLDGEVTADERARVERWLAESSQLRQLHDELVAMRTELKALPRQTLNRDLGAAVMRRTGPAAPQTPRPTENDGAIVPGTLAKWWERGLGARRLMWPAIAVAAALVILVYDANQRPGEQQVAQAPQSTAQPESSDLSEAPRPGDKTTLGEKSSGDKDSSREQGFAIRAPAADAPSTSEAAPVQGDHYHAREELQKGSGSALGAVPFQSAEMKRKSDILDGRERLERPAAPPMPLNAPASETSMPKAEQAVTGRSLAAAGAKADAPPTVICPVSPSYLQGADFEKLLTTNKIDWQRLPVSPQQKSQIEVEQRQSKVAAIQSLGAAPLQSLYYLRASDEQVNNVLSQVPQAAKLSAGNVVQLPRMTAPQLKRADEAASGVQVLLLAPNQPAPAAAPAKPAR